MYRTHKYWAKKTEIDWIKFDSQAEARIYKYMKYSDINIIELQPEFLLQESFKYNNKSIRAIKYIADFKIEYKWDIYYLDVKWMETPVYKLKYKLWLKRYSHESTLITVKSIKDLESKIK